MAESDLRKNLAPIALMLAIVGLLAVCGTREAGAAVPAEEGKIAFASTRDGNWEIYTMEVDGSGQTNLTNNAAADREPAFAPDGGNIVFTSDRGGRADVWSMDANGGNLTNLTNGAGQSYSPAYSPNGGKIAFASSRFASSDIYTMDADGSDQTRLTDGIGFSDTPAYSPDGSKIAFTSTRDGDWEIYTMDADGSDLKQITNTADEVLDLYPAYSPDGGRIAFARRGPDGSYPFDVWAMDPDGANQADITSRPGQESDPTYSPDGSRIAYSGTASEIDSETDIYTIGSAGGNATNLTDRAGEDADPDWRAPSTDLSLTQSDTPDPVTKDDVLTYRLRVFNSGYDTVPKVVLTDRLPDGVDFDGASSVCTHSNGTVTCDLGDLAARSSRTVTISVRTQTAGEITNTATVGGGIADPFPADNSDRESTQVILNVPPTAANDFYSGTEDRDVTVGPPGVLENDADTNGDRLTATLVEGPENAANFSLDPNGAFTYTPRSDFNGFDAFTYRAKDEGNVQSELATGTLRITSVNDRPVANDDTARTEKNTPVTINVLGNDLDAENDRLTIIDATDPPDGTVVVNSDNTLTYTPDADYVSEAGNPDRFSYTVRDPSGEPASATVIVEVGDTGAPSVVGVTPINATRTASATANVEVTFSERMDPATLGGSNFTLVEEGGSSPVDAEVRLDSAGKKAILDPTQSLDPGTTYVVTVEGGPGGASDPSGNELQGDEVWFFGVNSPPTITFRKPTPGSTTTNRTPTIGAKITDPQTDLSASTITLKQGSRQVNSFTYDRDTDRLTYKPSSELAFGSRTFTISATDAQGLTTTSTWSFSVVRR